LENGKEQFFTIKSNIEDYHVSGGSGSRAKGGPQDVVQDSKYLERKKHQLKQYFKEIASYLDEVDEVALFGPAGTNENSMTSNQVVALVKKYFKYF